MLIRDLVLYTPNLEKQYNFYIHNLGFPLVEKWSVAFCFRAGRSHFTFQESESESKVYHFAFGLKENKTSAALEYIRNRAEIIPWLENKSEIVEFPNWNAKSIYWYDADGNVVEFISRNGPGQREGQQFSISDVKSVCEIGLPVDNVEKAYSQFKYSFKLEKYSGHSENFCPVGDQEGMFILVSEYRNRWFPTQIPAQRSDLKAYIQNDCYKGEVACRGGKLSMF